MTPAEPLTPDQLRRRCDPASLGFETTAGLPQLAEPLGQSRAVEALRFGVGIRREGYHLFAVGPVETGKETVLRALLEPRAADEPVPPDVCYVHDFGDANKPKALRLPAGRGRELKQAFERLVEDLRPAITTALEADEVRSQKEAIEEEIKEQHDQGFSELRERAASRGVALLHTPMGFAFAPLKDGEVLPPDEYEKLPQQEKDRLERETARLEVDLRELFGRLRAAAKGARERVRALFHETTLAAAGHLIDEVRAAWADQAQVVAHLAAFQADVVENVQQFLGASDDGPATVAGFPQLGTLPGPAPWRRYLVNLFVDNAEAEGAPVVHEEHATFQNLLGRIEHLAHQGTLLTDFHLLRAGSLHRANGGYLLLDARDVLTQPFAWEGLKRALLTRKAHVESLGQTLSLVSTVSLEPEPVPLDVKVVLLGDRRLHFLLSQLDPDFGRLFKVTADFEDDVSRDPDAERQYARLVATAAAREDLRPFDSAAVARVVDEGARLAEDGQRLSVQVGRLVDLLREADHFAREAGRDVVSAEDVAASVEAGRRRDGRVRERLLEEIGRGTLFLTTRGAAVGQVNALSVYQVGRHAFGRPTRITARVRLGSGQVVDIEREVELGGPLHSKGVLILAGYLSSRYALQHPLSLAATLVFEQSYGPIDGDSASCAELCALLSALSGVPLEQRWAITGSVSQAGLVQPIGGVNEKIEGFFDAVDVLGATGEEGVIVPRANVGHLMLRDDVVEAVRAGRFRVHAVDTVDEALSLLTGTPAGQRDASGAFPAESVNALVEQRLVALAERRVELGRLAGRPAEGAGS